MGGPTGATGADGATGATGAKGDKGDKGDSGAINWTDRGNVAAYDFTLNSFTRDSTWRDLDLSAICPSGTKLVLLGIQLAATTANREGKFKTKDNANDINISDITTPAANVMVTADICVVPNANRFIQYWFTASVSWTIINLVVKGWFTG